MAAVVSQDLIFSKDKIGDVFDLSTDGIEFSLLTKSDKKRNYWYKNMSYSLTDEVSVKFTHTVVRVFDNENPQYIGYAVLVDVIEDGKSHQFLSYFPENPSARYRYAQLEKTKDYSFYLGNKKYSLASDGTIAEAKKEKQGAFKEFQDGAVGNEDKKFLLNKKSFSPSFLSSFSSTPEVSESSDKFQQSSNKRKKGRGLFNFNKLGSSNSDIESVGLSPEKDRASPVSPKIESPLDIERASSASPKIGSPLDIERASSASPKTKSVRFA